MYSPYLYARRSELLALRALLEDDINLSKMIPILEPVKADTSDIRRCLEAFSKKSQPIIVVVNPSLNEFSNNQPSQKKFRADINDLFSESACIIPGLEIGSNTSKSTLDKFFEKYSARPVSLILNNSSLDKTELIAYIQHANTQFSVTVNNKITTAQKELILIKSFIHNNDDFNKKNRNADYSGQEFFTDRHNLIADKAAGFGDYTITGKRFELGGGTPGAVAIHAIYKNPKTSDIWIQHFVSDETDRSVGSPESKFLEAARKLMREVKSRPKEFGWNSALAEYEIHVNQNTWSGLGKNKEYQIRHHISFMLDFLNKTI